MLSLLRENIPLHNEHMLMDKRPFDSAYIRGYLAGFVIREE
jgi:hypothetical protein